MCGHENLLMGMALLYDLGFDRPETHAIEKDGRLYYGQGLITGVQDLEKVELPDPHDDLLYEEAAAFAAAVPA